MIKSILKICLILLVQVGIYFGLYGYAGFSFAQASLNSLIFTLLFSGLVVEGKTQKNPLIWIIVFFNILGILVAFFILPSTGPRKANSISKKNFNKVMALQSSTAPYYSRKEKLKIRDSLFFLTLYEFNQSLKVMRKFERKNMFIRKLHNYIVHKKDQFENNKKNAIRTIPHFSNIYRDYEKKDYSGFIDSLTPFQNNRYAKFFIKVTKQKILNEVNPGILQKHFLKQIDGLLKNYYSANVLEHLLAVFPKLKKNYQQKLVEYEAKNLSYLDFSGLNQSATQYRDQFTIFTSKEKNYFLYAKNLITPDALYPLWIINVKIINDEGQEYFFPIMKVSSSALTFIDKKGQLKHIATKGIYSKIKNGALLIRNPMSISWFSLYKKDHQEIYQYIVKPFWKRFLKYFFSIIISILIAVFTIRYMKTVFTKKLSVFFYFLPILFFMVISLIYSNLVIKVSNLFFEIF